MKYGKLAFLLVAVIMISKPIMLSAQMATPENICKQAKMDAHKDVNGCLWFQTPTLFVLEFSKFQYPHFISSNQRFDDDYLPICFTHDLLYRIIK